MNSKTFDTQLNNDEEKTMQKSVGSILECVDLVEKRWSSTESDIITFVYPSNRLLVSVLYMYI